MTNSKIFVESTKTLEFIRKNNKSPSPTVIRSHVTGERKKIRPHRGIVARPKENPALSQYGKTSYNAQVVEIYAWSISDD